MTNENKLNITVNGKYKNIDLNLMDSGDSIIVTKVHDAVKRTPKKGTKFNPEKEWTMCQTQVKYKNDDVGFFLPSGWGSKNGQTAFVENTEYSDMFDAVAKAGENVRITASKGIGKNSKGKEIVLKTFTFEKVQ